MGQNNILKNSKNDIPSFKSAISGYSKKEVDSFFMEYKNSKDSTNKLYQEKIEELKDNIKIVSKELELSKSENQKLLTQIQKYEEELTQIEDKSTDIENIYNENKKLKESAKEFEAVIQNLAELKVINQELENNSNKLLAENNSILAKLNELQNSLSQKEAQLKQFSFKYKSEISENNIKLEIADDKRKSELTKLKEMINDTLLTIEKYL